MSLYNKKIVHIITRLILCISYIPELSKILAMYFVTTIDMHLAIAIAILTITLKLKEDQLQLDYILVLL